MGQTEYRSCRTLSQGQSYTLFPLTYSSARTISWFDCGAMVDPLFHIVDRDWVTIKLSWQMFSDVQENIVDVLA